MRDDLQQRGALSKGTHAAPMGRQARRRLGVYPLPLLQPGSIVGIRGASSVSGWARVRPSCDGQGTPPLARAAWLATLPAKRSGGSRDRQQPPHAGWPRSGSVLLPKKATFEPCPSSPLRGPSGKLGYGRNSLCRKHLCGVLSASSPNRHLAGPTQQDATDNLLGDHPGG
jgi:hypothetical protein